MNRFRINNFLSLEVFAVIILASIGLYSCKKDTLEKVPVIFTGIVNNVTETGALFNGKILGIDNNEFVECGFVWSTNANPTIENSEYYPIKAYPGETPFSASVNSALIKNKNYIVRTYCVTRSKTYYGLAVSFLSRGSEGPVITGIEPSSGFIGDSVTITGRNFGSKYTSNVVRFFNSGSTTGVKAAITKWSNNTIVAVVPKVTSVTQDIAVTFGGATNKYMSGYTIITPTVTSFSPTTFLIGDTITLYGTHLDKMRSSYKVIFSGIEAKIIGETNERYIKVIIPAGSLQVTGSIVFMATLTTIILPGYTLITPAITSYSPSSFYPNDTITLYGTLLDQRKYSFKVMFGSTSASLVNELDKNYLKVVVPGNLLLSKGSITFVTSVNSTILSDQFAIKPPEIYRIEPASITSGQQIKVTGIGFSQSSPTNNLLVVNNVSTVASSSSKKVAYYTLVHNSIIFPGRESTAYVQTGECKSAVQTIQINDRWLRVNNFPDAGLYSLAVSDGSRAFAGILEHNIFYRFDDPGSYTRMADFPGTARSHSVAFIIGDFLYYGNGIDPKTMSYLNDFWRYDINANTWLKLNDFPFISRQNATGFTDGTYGYITSGATKIDGTMVSLDDCWRYNPSMDSWEQIASYGDLVEGTDDALSKPAAVNDGEGTIYVCGKELYDFNTQTGIWTHISSYPVVLSGVTYYGFYRNGKVYVGTSSRLLYAYDTLNKTWEQVTTELISGNNYLHMTSFMFNSKIYIGFGRQQAIWEFDPDR